MRSARACSSALALAVALGLGTALPLAPAQASDPGSPGSPGRSAAEVAEQRLRADAEGPVVVHHDGASGEADFVAALDEPVPAPAGGTAAPVRAAEQHLDRYGALLGVERPRAELDPDHVVATGAGSHVVVFAQEVDGLPVIGGEVAVSVDGDGDLESVNGETTGSTAPVPAAAVAAGAAARTAVVATARAHRVPADSLDATEPTRWMYDPALIGSPDPFGARPVWRVEVANGTDIRRLVLVDSATGGVVESTDEIMHVEREAVCNRRVQRGRGIDRPCLPAAYRLSGRASQTADAGPFGAGQDVKAGFAFAGDTSLLYRALGRDLTSLIGNNAGAGRRIHLTVRLGGENAFWNGREAYFSDGFALADDIVAHELSHGVIERLSGLAYWYQSGAINESIADVFGEIVDQRNDTRPGEPRWVLGEDSPLGTLRSMRSPSSLRVPGVPRQPASMRSRFYQPDRDLVDNGAVHINSGVGNKAAYLIAHGGRFNGRVVHGIDRTGDLTKTARIYLRVLPMLTSGSDYADLGRLLPQACRALVGRGGVTARDCRQVRRAVLATQMLRQPRTATAPEAPRCAPRATTRRLFRDTMERARPVWSRGPLWSRLPRRGFGLPLQPYATSGTHSLFGRDPDPSIGTARSGSLTLRRAVRVPRRGSTFLRFEHARLFEHNFRTGRRARFFDGGRVELSTDGGRTWTNAASLPWVNGPGQRITDGRTAYRGFGGDSHGYMSSRLNLTRFAGRAVRLRWTVSGDRTVGFFGWWLDDVEVLNCRG